MMSEHSCYENMPGAFCLMRADGSERIVRCNEMMLALFQCSTEKDFLKLTGGCLRGMVIAEDYRQISAQLGVWQREKSADAHYLDCQLPATEVASLRESFDTSICLDRPGLLHSQSCEVQQRSGNYQSH